MLIDKESLKLMSLLTILLMGRGTEKALLTKLVL